MGIIYEPPEQHRCRTPPGPLVAGDKVWPYGTIWQCDDCGKYYVRSYEIGNGPFWKSASWWECRKIKRQYNKGAE